MIFKGGDNVAWMKLANVCKTNMVSGLDVRDLRLVNLAILSKSRWMILLNVPLLWKNICLVRYGSDDFGYLLGGKVGGLSRVSQWWRGISLLRSPLDVGYDWFVVSCVQRFRDGQKIRFLHDVWVDATPLCVSFERLFLVSRK